MSKKRESKTNAMRILDAAHVDHVIHSVDATGEDTGVDIAHRAGEDPDHVFKTLVTQGKSGEHLVFMIPVACELDLTVIDETCILFDTILFSGGRIGTQIEMSFDDLANIIEIEAVDLVV